MSIFFDYLKERHTKTNSLLCIGLDPEIEFLPDEIKNLKEPFFEFNKLIIDNTSDYALCYKPQFAHYSAFSRESELEKTIRYIKLSYPDIPVILDSKRGDIGNTAKYYATESFDRYGADAVTINPYMGFDSVEPFLSRKDKGLFFLCKTSNPGSSDFQNLLFDGIPLYLKVAKEISDNWNKNKNCGLVVGGTNLEDFKGVMESNISLPILVPGIGAQGGSINDLKSITKSTNAVNQKYNFNIYNVSRAIIRQNINHESDITKYFDNVRESARKFYLETTK